MPELFDMKLRAIRRDRASRVGTEPFLYERAFEDCLERVGLQERRFDRALLIGCPEASWHERMKAVAATVEVRDPGPLFACMAGGNPITEDAWQGEEAAYDLVVSMGTLDTVNGLPLALRSVRYAMSPHGFFIGALAGGDTLPQLRSAMRAADALSGIAAPHVHPRIEASALSPLLSGAGFANSVVDVDRVTVFYPSFQGLVGDLRSMGATNILTARPRFIGKDACAAAAAAFAAAGNGGRTAEIFEILHFAAWTPKKG